MKFLQIALDKRRLNGARTDGVDAQGFGVVDSQLAGHGDDGALAGAIGKALFDSHEAGDGGDVDDGARMAVVVRVELAGKKQRQERARHQVNSADIDFEDAIEVLRFGGLNGAYMSDAGVVDKNVEAA